MMKPVTLVIALLVAVSSALAQSFLPQLDTTSTVSDTNDMLEPSYGVYAGVEPIATVDDVVEVVKVSGLPSYLQGYGAVSSKMYYE